MTDNGITSPTDEREHFPSLADRARASTRHVTKNGLASPTHSAHANFFRASILQVTSEKKAKKVRFYRNGDRFFNGMIYAVSQERFRTLDSLMADLTASPICDKTILPMGVRHIFTIDGSHRVTSLDQLEDGGNYVVSTAAAFRRVDYPVSSRPIPCWNVNPQSGSEQWDRSLTGRGDVGNGAYIDEDRKYIRPKLITVIRNGSRPRKAVRILLNKKTAHSFDQVLTEITDTIKLDSGTVKKIFTITGKQIITLPDFFKDENVFVAYGSEKYSLDDFDLTSNEIQFVSAYNRSVRQLQSVTLKSPKMARREMPSSSSRSLQERTSCHSSPQSPRRVISLLSKPKSPVPNSSKYSNGHSTNIISDTDFNEPTALRVKYKIGKQIGEGNFAIVKECTEKARKLQFALKIINKNKCQGKEETIENEVSILRQIKHANIVQLVEEFDTPCTLYLVMELVTGGDLFDAIAEATKYTEKDARGMLHNLASAIKYLHSKNIVHRDIKPENLLVHDIASGVKSLKLGDFGLATDASKLLYTVCGTPTYVAPEVLSEIGYGVKIDVWSVGVVAYILLCGFPPFSSEGNNREELFDKIQAAKFDFVSPFWDDISNSAKELIKALLQLDVDQRLSATELLQHPWIADDKTARDDDIHTSVANQIVEFAKTTKKIRSKQPGVAIIMSTALDKGSRYFQGRKNLKCVQLAGDELF